MKNSKLMISSDTPGKDPTKDDLLFYGPFAEHLANGIQKMFNPYGFVISINGEWGSGKSTVLNFIKYYLNKMPEESRPVIIEFNPWWFSGRDDLIRQLFLHFGIGISKNMKNAEEVTKLFGEYILAVSSIILPELIQASLDKCYNRSLDIVLKNFDPNKKSIAELKNEIIEKISSKGKILIIIDDIDRLNSEEIRQIFQVIKTVAEFPNVVFLLSFDKKVVVQVLQKIQNLPGEEYLEKIIQAQFDIPYPEKELLSSLLSNKLELLFSNYDKGFMEDQYWRDIFSNGISQLTDTPRDINRFVNSLDVTYPSVFGEVNPIDFIALEAMRIFQSETYDLIRKYPSAFTGYGGLGPERLYDKKFYEDYRDLSKTKSYAIDFISIRLFPKYSHRLEKTYNINWKLMRRDLRLCSPEIFPTYFWMTIPPYRVAKKEIQRIIGLTSDKDKFKTYLMEMAKQSGSSGINRVNYIFSRLTDHAEDDIPTKNILEILPCLYEIPDEILIQQVRLSPNDFVGDYFREGDFIRDLLLSRLTEPKRFENLKQVISDLNTLYSITFDIRRLFEKDGNHTCSLATQNKDQMLTPEHINDLITILVSKYEFFANTKELLKSPNLRFILESWDIWAENKEQCHKWVQELCDSDQKIAKILEEFITVLSHGNVNGVWYSVDFNLKSFEKFVNISNVYSRVSRIKTNKGLFNSFSGRERIAIEKFLDAYLSKMEKEELENPIV